MKPTTFYLLATGADEPRALLDLVCTLATERYRQGQSIFILAASQEQAEQLDEQLWQQDTRYFVPHALSEEPTVQQAPVEIGTFKPKRNRQLLINLSNDAPPFAGRFAEVVDFVPTDETRKQLARERYKQYRAVGFTLQTLPAPQRDDGAESSQETQ